MQSTESPTKIQFDKGNKIYEGVFDQSLHFRIQMHNDAAMQFIRRIGGYNDFQPENVIKALEYIDRLLPRRYYHEGNPNNGERRYEISVGREGSPVIYLDFHEWGNEDYIDTSTLKTICGVASLGGLADEADFAIEQIAGFGGSRQITFRFWWD
jgi:hypothetical protein